MTTSQDILEWRMAGKHLPKFMQGFHDQKDLFKTIDQFYSDPADVNWRDGQIYVIDRFLWFMAEHGYKLQKARAGIAFKDIDTTLANWTKLRKDAEAKLLMEHIGAK